MIHIQTNNVKRWAPGHEPKHWDAPPVEKRIRYYCNFSRRNSTAWISTREGLVFEAESLRLPSEPRGLIILIDYAIMPNAASQIEEHMNSGGDRHSRELKCLKEDFQCIAERDPLPPAMRRKSRHAMMHVVPEEEIRKNGGVVYVERLDVTVSLTKPKYDDHLHPYSVQGMAARELTRSINAINSQQPMPLMQSDFIYTLSIVDNSDTIGPRYISTPTGIVKITPRKDLQTQSGFYVGYRDPDDGPHTVPEVKIHVSEDGKDIPWFVLHETPEEAKLYRSEDAAIQARTKIRELEVRETESLNRLKESENKLSAAELARDKAVRDAEALTMSIQAERERHKNQLEEMARQMQLSRAKAHAEIQSLRRKNTSELFKTTPSILSGLMSLALLLIKIAKP